MTSPLLFFYILLIVMVFYYEIYSMCHMWNSHYYLYQISQR